MDQFIRDNYIVILALLALWSIPWKGVALWKAARKSDTAWFILLLIVNTLGILEIFYIFIFSKRTTGKEISAQNRH